MITFCSSIYTDSRVAYHLASFKKIFDQIDIDFMNVESTPRTYKEILNFVHENKQKISEIEDQYGKDFESDLKFVQSIFNQEFGDKKDSEQGTVEDLQVE